MRTVVLGAGMTGIAVGRASNGIIYESCDLPGGLCCSYYMEPGDDRRRCLPSRRADAYRFEIGGGHWIFGGDVSTLGLMRGVAPMRAYRRRAAVYFSKQRRYVPYPLQNNLEALDPAIARQAAAEMDAADDTAEPPVHTMKEQLARRFGPTLCDLFFHRFHELYTAGLYDQIAPQDEYKSPRRSLNGYNETFVYPVNGLDSLARGLAEACNVEYERRAIGIDVRRREVTFADGGGASYDALVSTLPLNSTLDLAGLEIDARRDPHTSVLVLNIGATRGPAFPSHHWLYVADADSGFHRIGFYSNIDRSFVPAKAGRRRSLGSMYVERAYVGGAKPDAPQIAQFSAAVVAELRRWGFIDEVEVVDASWIDVAYTWSWPGSAWRQEALRALSDRRIHPAGRYGCWIFQGIADSIRDGLNIGAGLRSSDVPSTF